MDVRRTAVSLRKNDVGGPVQSPPQVTDEHALLSAFHLVLLIHGYNNDKQAAADAYAGFHRRQQELDATGNYGLGRVFAEVYWPGDADWGIASFLFYMGSIGQAQKSAAALADYLGARFPDGGLRIDLVAHSMGCRLALELMWQLEKRNGPRIARAVLMAGAVPTFMLAGGVPPGELRPGYDRMLAEGARSLYSMWDMVLAAAFPAGQTLAGGGEGIAPVALGHELWAHSTVPMNLSQIENPGAGHSQYWGWDEDPGPLRRARLAAKEIRDYLRFPSAGSRDVAGRPLVERSAEAARKIAAERELRERQPLFYGA